MAVLYDNYESGIKKEEEEESMWVERLVGTRPSSIAFSARLRSG